MAKAQLDLEDANRGRLNVAPAWDRVKAAEDKVASLEAQRAKLETNQQRDTGQLDLLKQQVKNGEMLTKKGVIIDPNQDADRRARIKQLDAQTGANTVGLADNAKAIEAAMNNVQLAKGEVEQIRKFNGPTSQYDIKGNIPFGPQLPPPAEPNALLQAIEDERAKAKNKFQVGSIGTFQASVAQNFDRFLPTFDPLLDQAVKTNNTLTSIDKKMGLLTEQAVF